MKPTKNKIYCRDCGRTKMLFESEKKAQNFIKFNKDEIEEESGYSPQRIYFCLFCNGWHTTSIKNSLGISNKEKMLQQIKFEETERREKQKIINSQKQNEINEELRLEKFNLTNEIENIINDFELFQKQKYIKESILITTEEIKKLKTAKIKSDKETIKKKRLLLEVLNILDKTFEVKIKINPKDKKDEWKAWIEKTMKTTK